MPDNTFYVTTPIYYVNDVPHIGHSYTTIAADVLARYHRLRGADVHFLTGTDEHGTKVQRAAEANGETPLEYATRIAKDYQALWQRFDITYDDFIRTTEPRHETVVRRLFEELHKRGDLTLGEYAGWYCASCENFLAEGDLVDGNCPDCGKKAEWASEATYYFRMSKYEDRLVAFLDEHPEFIRPQARYNEIVNRVKEGLRDVSFTRTSLEWGVSLPFDEGHVTYVWIDALINYISALGYPDGELYDAFWRGGADVLHLVGKDIIWFHCVIWPCVLMALDLPIPKTVYAHGWWTNDGEKMSKSKGNFIDPITVTEKYGVDAYRYFLLREMPFGQDGDFSETALVGRINNDLGNDLGNLLHRTLTMIEKYCSSVVPPTEGPGFGAADLDHWTRGVGQSYYSHMDNVEFSRALEDVWELIRTANQRVEASKPWVLAKDAQKAAELNTVLYSLAATLRVVSALLWPFMPAKMEEMRTQLGCAARAPNTLDVEMNWNGPNAGAVVAKGAPLFPKIED
ncbi:MAG: methionine--tRNA ligase [Planctomycetota bacterium]